MERLFQGKFCCFLRDSGECLYLALSCFLWPKSSLSCQFPDGRDGLKMITQPVLGPMDAGSATGEISHLPCALTIRLSAVPESTNGNEWFGVLYPGAQNLIGGTWEQRLYFQLLGLWRCCAVPIILFTPWLPNSLPKVRGSGLRDWKGWTSPSGSLTPCAIACVL